jgi:Spy/CpxP family protein refolding chaperone
MWEGWMKLAYMVAAVLVFPLMAAAQTSVAIAPQTAQHGTAAGIGSPGFSLPGGLNPPAEMFDQFWNDPAFAAELHLTDGQRKRLQDASLNQRLALIDGGADAMKAVAHLAAILEADQLDDAAYQQQLNNLAAAAGKLVQDFGEMTVSPRRILTLEQWRKLQSLQRAKRAAAKAAAPPRQPGMRAPAACDRP